MEDFYFNITSQNESYDYLNTTSYLSNYWWDNYDWIHSQFVYFVVTVITISISLPLTLVAIYALYCQVRNDHVAPIYVINLLISDFIQLCCMIVWVAPHIENYILYIISTISYYCCLVASVCFMVCIALERYLVIVHPLWYRYRRTIKISVGVCVLVWVLCLGCLFLIRLISSYFLVQFETPLSIFLLLPLPFFIFFLGGTLKALSTTRVPSDEKQRIVAVLVLVLLIYTLLFLPGIIFSLTQRRLYRSKLYNLYYIFIQFSPLADLILYVFMRKGTIDKFLSSVCCCRMDSDDTNSSSV